MLALQPNARIGNVVRAVASALTAVVTVTPDGSGPIAAVYDYEPGLLEDAYPAMTVQNVGFDREPGGSNEVLLPNVLSYVVHFYYPVVDLDPAFDGLKAAQDKTLDALDHWFHALIGDPQLAGKVIFAYAPSGRIRGVSDDEDINQLYVYEATVRVSLH